MAQELTARQVTDAVTYGLELYRKEAAETGSKVLPLSDDWKTFAFGYSQGGSTTLFKVFDDDFSTKDHVDGGFTFFTSLGLMHGLAPYFKWLAE